MFLLQRPDDHRRKWDVDDYEKKSSKREHEDDDEEEEEDEDKPAAPKRELLKARDYKVTTIFIYTFITL